MWKKRLKVRKRWKNQRHGDRQAVIRSTHMQSTGERKHKRKKSRSLTERKIISDTQTDASKITAFSWKINRTAAGAKGLIESNRRN